MRIIALTAQSALLLCSCASNDIVDEDVKAINGSNAQTCAAAQYQAIVGQALGEIDTENLPWRLRIYSVYTPVSMDHLPERLNIVVGDDGRIVNVNCR